MRIANWMVALGALTMVACGGGDDDTTADTDTDAADTAVSWVGSEAEGAVPAWWPYHMYYTCGDPVCSGYTASGLPPCQKLEGDPCRHPDRVCDPGVDFCNRRMTCSDVDPVTLGCPISRASFKRDIAYVDEKAAEQVHDELMDFKLATWAYNHDGAQAPEHFGFIIDDVEPSPSVSADGDHVDLYGYTSMAVAALQVQARQIEALQAQVERLEAKLAEQE